MTLGDTSSMANEDTRAAHEETNTTHEDTSPAHEETGMAREETSITHEDIRTIRELSSHAPVPDAGTYIPTLNKVKTM